MKTILLLSLLILSACSSSPVKLSKATAVTSERFQSTPKVVGEPGKLVVVRDTGGAGNLADVVLKIDGIEVVNLKTGEKVELDMSAGNHILGVKLSTNDRITETTVQIKSKEQSVFRISTGDMYQPYPTIQATAELTD